jgi:hypothetical protein
MQTFYSMKPVGLPFQFCSSSKWHIHIQFIPLVKHTAFCYKHRPIMELRGSVCVYFENYRKSCVAKMQSIALLKKRRFLLLSLSLKGLIIQFISVSQIMIRLPWFVSVAGCDVSNPPSLCQQLLMAVAFPVCFYASVNFVLPVRIADCFPPQSVSEDSLAHSSIFTHWMIFF